jgi:hypothetical protein
MAEACGACSDSRNSVRGRLLWLCEFLRAQDEVLVEYALEDALAAVAEYVAPVRVAQKIAYIAVKRGRLTGDGRHVSSNGDGGGRRPRKRERIRVVARFKRAARHRKAYAERLLVAVARQRERGGIEPRSSLLVAAQTSERREIPYGGTQT